MCFCLIYFNLGNFSSCVDMYLGNFVNRIEIEKIQIEIAINFPSLDMISVVILTANAACLET